jgi:hypothetical protein
MTKLCAYWEQHICSSPYAHNFIMQTGIPVCEYFIDPRPYAYGDPYMHTAIPVCIILHMGIQDLISHMETVPVCIRLVPEISLYAYRHLTNPRMQTGISIMRSPYAYGDHQDPRMHTGIELNSHMCTGIGVMRSLYAYRDLQDPHMHMWI